MAESQPDSTCTKKEESGTQTVVVDKVENQPSPPILQLRLQQPKSDHKVKWTTDTVDNEFMGKKKSKCCCIYEKPKVFGESDSSSSDEDEEGCTPHCRGHKKKCFRHHDHNHDHSHDNHGHDHNGAHNDGAGPSTSKNA